MKSIEERKLTLTSQIHQLKRELDKIKRQDYGALQLSTGTARGRYVGLDEYDSKLQK